MYQTIHPALVRKAIKKMVMNTGEDMGREQQCWESEDSHYRNECEGLSETKSRTSYDPATPLLWRHPQNVFYYTDICMSPFIPVLYTIARKWNQLRYLALTCKMNSYHVIPTTTLGQ